MYDLYAAEDIQHPDGVSGTVDYSKIVDANGNPIWHTTILTNGGWDTDYLPILAKDHLVASAEIQNGVLAFANLYLGKYYLVERATGIVLPLDGDGQYYVSGQYPVLDRTLQPTGEYADLETNRDGEYTDYVYKNQYSVVAEGRALTGVKTYDGYYLSFAEGYLCDEINHYETLTYGGRKPVCHPRNEWLQGCGAEIRFFHPEGCQHHRSPARRPPSWKVRALPSIVSGT